MWVLLFAFAVCVVMPGVCFDFVLFGFRFIGFLLAVEWILVWVDYVVIN